MTDLTGKTIFVAGGSSGLGKDLAIGLAARGANVTIFARRQSLLDETERAVLDARKEQRQVIRSVSVDLADPSQVNRVFREEATMPDILYCVAGGTAQEIGFITDIEPACLESCMRNNYLTSAYASQCVLKMWTEDDKAAMKKGQARGEYLPRQIVFINSVAAFLGIPGYGAYTASKCAARGLADTLRMECLRLSNSRSKYTVHIAFPSNFISPAFVAEQEKKPELCKKIEGTESASIPDLMRRLPSSADIATKIITNVERGDFALCDDSFETGLAFASMVGPSPRRGLGIVDSILSVIVGIFDVPIYRYMWDQMSRHDGEQMRTRVVEEELPK